ncbi:hypothetical protein EX895_002968 [Sporisorium graminicola]|uniref:Ricin B lectin domain-containing protein n=1 Tax=Sporisorium graminicola TaxID=280036 RepID=A0A4U7KXX3_9BASI|nr:hypothetical protein EX895_002968 [Sporisorium graminicola]TKY88258.1 hypothetical protein EX895_002968 [Sporisorium graminicola]
MKSMVSLCALVSATLTTSVAAVPTPSLPIGRRQGTCGAYLVQAEKLKAQSDDGTDIAWLSYVSQGSDRVLELTATSATDHNQVKAPTLSFQECGYQGFTQGYSRNEHGSMGAPLEYWGRVVNHLEAANGDSGSELVQTCLSASNTGKAGTFHFHECDETDSKQWFRMQESLGGNYIDYFPVKNTTGYKYDGQTPEKWQIPIYSDPHAYHDDPVQYTGETTYQYVLFN